MGESFGRRHIGLFLDCDWNQWLLIKTVVRIEHKCLFSELVHEIVGIISPWYKIPSSLISRIRVPTFTRGARLQLYRQTTIKVKKLGEKNNQLACSSNMLQMGFLSLWIVDNLLSIPAGLNNQRYKLNAWCDLKVFPETTEPPKNSGYEYLYKGYVPRIIVQNIWKATLVENKKIEVCSPSFTTPSHFHERKGCGN